MWRHGQLRRESQHQLHQRLLLSLPVLRLLERKMSENLRGKPYDISAEEIARRAREAWDRGATEVCMQGGIHPDYTGQTYLDIVTTVKRAAPDIHVHAFSPLEVWQGAATLEVSLKEFLCRLKMAGLSTLPGTAAEILHDEIREQICADKLNTAQWLEVMRTAHEVGFKSTATIMFGHVDRPKHWAAHLHAIRKLQDASGGFTEFVPLPYVAAEAPMYRKGKSRLGPTLREALLMHAVPRLALNGAISNIQTSWVKMGREGAMLALQCGANDLGGSLMNESITRAAGAEHGQEWSPRRDGHRHQRSWTPSEDAHHAVWPRPLLRSRSEHSMRAHSVRLSTVTLENFRQASL